MKIFENKDPVPGALAIRVARLVEDFGKYSSKIYGNACVQNNKSSKKWIAPPEGIIKINTDASLGNDGWIGLGVIARNYKGEVLFCATIRVRAFWPPEVAECKALIMALRLGRRYGCANVIIESDCKLLVDRLSKEVIYCTDLDSILEDVLFRSGFFKSLWSHVKRDGNCVAHHR